MKKKKISDRAVEYVLTRNLEDLGRLTTMKIAAAIGVSLSYLSRKFKKDQKITLDEFITREKIHTAIYILDKNRGIPIGELAVKLGFPDTGDFSSAFRDYIAIDPGRYRELQTAASDPLPHPAKM